MTEFFKLHHDTLRPRAIEKAVEALRDGGVVIYPTDSCYALACLIGSSSGLARIRHLRGLPSDHPFTLACASLKDVGHYAQMNNSVYRTLRSLTPGPYTFVLPASRDTQKKLRETNRRTVGIRVPNHPVAQSLLSALNEPLLSTTLMLPEDSFALTDPSQIRERLSRQVDVILTNGACGLQPTTVLEMTSGVPEVLRHGKGAVGRRIN